jgi:[acyl-carrier-protein] S-malonyltransferase/trans-AT polyketide synthase/acyltransferase/oxidoreductase domain-containing protein
MGSTPTGTVGTASENTPGSSPPRALRLDAALRLVRLRGRLMQSAVPVGEGGMLAVIQNGLDLERVAASPADHDVDVANFNSPPAVVLSGGLAGLDAAEKTLEAELGPAGGRVVKLEVSAPFHSRALRVIEDEFRAALEAEAGAFDAPRARAVTSNFLGGFHSGDHADLIDALTRQISGSVRWIENMRAIATFPGGGALYEGRTQPAAGALLQGAGPRGDVDHERFAVAEKLK